MLRYRLLYDYYVITISNDDSNYSLRAVANDSDEMDNQYDNVLKMYESMLFVNSSSRTYYFWLPELLKFVDGKTSLSYPSRLSTDIGFGNWILSSGRRDVKYLLARAREKLQTTTCSDVIDPLNI